MPEKDNRRKIQLGGGPLRRHPGAEIPGSWVRYACPEREVADLLPESGRSERARHFVRPERALQPADPPYAGSHLSGICRRSERSAFQAVREIPQESVVRQRHPPSLFDRQVPAGIYRGLFRRVGSRYAENGFSDGFRFRGTGDSRDQTGRFRPGGDAQTGEPRCRRRYYPGVGQQLLRRGLPARGRGVLCRPDGPERPDAGFLRIEQQVGQRRRRTVSGAGLESGRHVFSGDRKDRLLVAEGFGGGCGPSEGNDRCADRFL